MVIAILLVTFLTVPICYDADIFRSRFKALYPETDFTYWQFTLLGAFPFTFIAMIGFLYVKEPVSYIKKSLPFRYSFCLLIPVFCLQLINIKFAYYLGSPSTYFVIKTATEAMDLVSYHNHLTDRDSVFMKYQAKVGKMSSTQIILATAVSAAAIIKDKQNIDKINNSPKVAFYFGERLLSELADILVVSEKSEFEFTDYSLLQWLHPAGAIEIALNAGIENEIMNKFKKGMFEKDMEILTNIEKNVDRLPASDQVYYTNKFKNIREKFETSKTLKVIQLDRMENHFPVK